MHRFALIALLVGCGGDDGGDARTAISGRVGAITSARAALVEPVSRTITHVMAVNPESASPDRALAAVGSDGSFVVPVKVGKPYVLVFVDSSAVGADMVVGIFRANTLDTLSPQLAGHLELGDVMVDPQSQTASSGVAYDDLLASLGLSPETAEYLGSVDDLSLRYANPDIDGDGVIDIEQDRRYSIDFHVRANMFTSDRVVTVDDITDTFLPFDGAQVATPVFNLTSIYVLYPASLDATEYVPYGMPGVGLQNGGAFTATTSDGPATSPSSFSSLGFGDTRGWGPDYNFEQSHTLELPGSAGTPAMLRYTLGGIGRTLTFSNVVTTARATWTQSGTLAIFVKLVTGADGGYSQIDYEWRKLTDSTWVPATEQEIAVTISGDGGYISIHHVPSWHNEFGTRIPAQPSGSIAWTFASTRPSEVCGLAVSYDDKLGMRHFLGGANPNAGVSCTQ